MPGRGKRAAERICDAARELFYRDGTRAVGVEQIVAHAGPTEVVQHDLADQGWEHAAARGGKPWVSHLWVENHSNAHCIYCALFEKNLP